MLIDEIYERMNIEAKAKEKRLYYEYENKIKNEKIDIVDWGCGQAIATMLLLNYAKEKPLSPQAESFVRYVKAHKRDF